MIVANLLGLLLSMGVAYGLWYALESPILRWKDRMIPNRTPEFGSRTKPPRSHPPPPGQDARIKIAK
jgi:peptidoglycan/LPS O-acetylase OafA/YrhL